jgi:hypothetical protein
MDFNGDLRKEKFVRGASRFMKSNDPPGNSQQKTLPHREAGFFNQSGKSRFFYTFRFIEE